MIRKILAPTDGSPISQKAVAYAADLANQMSASLTLLAVVDTNYLLAPGMPPELSPGGIRESTEDLLRQATNSYLDEAAIQCEARGIGVTKIVRTGQPVAEIVKQAEADQSDLIVLGSHGRSAMEAVMLGSVAYGVLHKDAKVPVLVVR